VRPSGAALQLDPSHRSSQSVSPKGSSGQAMATRAEFLERIRREARRTDGLFKAATATRPARPEEAAEAVRRQLAERWPEARDLFRREFDRVGGVFHRAADRAEVPSVVLEIAREEGATAVVAWDPAVLGLDLR